MAQPDICVSYSTLTMRVAGTSWASQSCQHSRIQRQTVQCTITSPIEDMAINHFRMTFKSPFLHREFGFLSRGAAVAEWVRAQHWRPSGSGFESCWHFASAIPFTPHCLCLSEETLKAVGPFHLVSMPGEVKEKIPHGG